MLDKFQFTFNGHIINKKAIGNGLSKLVTVCGNTVLKLKNLVGVLVDLVLGRSSKTNQRSIKIIKNILVFVIDRAVRLVHDDKIKVADGKQLFIVIILNRINAIHHRLISREYTTRIKVLLVLAEISHRQIG